MSRRDVQRFAPLPGSALISIHDVSEPALEFHEPWGPVLHLRFHDAQPGTGGLELFSAEQAKQVLAFNDAHSVRAPEVIVHCHAGHSRSAAIALFLASKSRVACLKNGIEQTVKNHKFYNRFVYQVLVDCSLGLPMGNE